MVERGKEARLPICEEWVHSEELKKHDECDPYPSAANEKVEMQQFIQPDT